MEFSTLNETTHMHGFLQAVDIGSFLPIILISIIWSQLLTS